MPPLDVDLTPGFRGCVRVGVWDKTSLASQPWRGSHEELGSRCTLQRLGHPVTGALLPLRHDHGTRVAREGAEACRGGINGAVTGWTRRSGREERTHHSLKFPPLNLKFPHAQKFLIRQTTTRTRTVSIPSPERQGTRLGQNAWTRAFVSPRKRVIIFPKYIYCRLQNSWRSLNFDKLGNLGMLSSGSPYLTQNTSDRLQTRCVLFVKIFRMPPYQWNYRFPKSPCAVSLKVSFRHVQL